MPGLTGLISTLPDDEGLEKLRRMTGVMLHESFYRHGLHSEGGTFVGWTCHEGSFADCMPIVNERRDVVLFLAGEVFPDPDSLLELRRKGHDFAEGDAGYLVHLYEALGEDFFERLNGQFSGLLIDRRTDRTFLFNDRYGMHRLFVHSGREGFYFASEAKALLAVLPETREFDPKGLAELLTCGCTLGERSLFKDIRVLPGGSLLEFSHGELSRRTLFFNRESWEAQAPLTEREFTSRFLDLFPRVVGKYASSRLPVGLSLTGGFDSRMVIAALDPPPGTLPCYTFGSMYRDTYDVKVSREVARACGQTHETLVVGEEFLSRLPEYLERAVFLSDGYLGLSGAAELYANALAREIAPVRLTGNYGSELLRGVRAFKFSPPRDGLLTPDFLGFVEEARATFETTTLMRPVSFAAFQQAPHQGYGRLAIERSQLELRTPFLHNEVVELGDRAPNILDGFALCEAVVGGGTRSELLSIPTDRGFLGPRLAAGRLLRRSNRQCLFRGEYFVGHGAPDWYVKLESALGLGFLERLLVGRHKFCHLRRWIGERLPASSLEIIEFLRSSKMQDYIDFRAARRMATDHFLCRNNNTSYVDLLLTLGLTAKILLTDRRGSLLSIARIA